MSTSKQLRVEKLQRLMQKEDLSAIICRLPENVVYITDYWPHHGISVALLPREGKPVLFVPEVEQEYTQPEWAEVVPFGWGLLKDKDLYENYRELIASKAAAWGLKGKKVGAELSFEVIAPGYRIAEPVVPSGPWQLLLHTLFEDASLVDATPLLLQSRAVKTEYEIEKLRIANNIAELGINEALSNLKPSQSEAEIGALIEYTLGPEAYNGLWSGKTDWGSPEVKVALENFAKLLTYANSDSASLSWQDASQLVVNGDAAFNVMGDWAEGYFRELGKTPQVDYGWAPVPGTSGTFQFLSDSFVLAAGAPHPDGAIAWLKVAGSKAGQEAFNPVKGSICARTDCDKSLFGEYLQSAMNDWATNTVVGSLTHGVVANDSWKSEIDTALGLFVQDGNVNNFQAALVAACKSSGPCK